MGRPGRTDGMVSDHAREHMPADLRHHGRDRKGWRYADDDVSGNRSVLRTHLRRRIGLRLTGSL